MMPVCVAGLMASHPPSSCLPPNRSTLSPSTSSPKSKPARILTLSLHRPKSQLFSSSSLTGSTWKVTALLPSKFVASYTLPTVAASRPLFFSPISDGSAPGTPIAVIAAGLARRCIEIYGRVLLIRFLFSLYPNLEWDKQPMTAIKDLCDPFLGLFRGIIPPLFNSLDVTPLLAFLLLAMLGQFTKSPGLF